jgi:hypothetical protein
MSDTITLAGDYGQTYYRVTGLDSGTTIDANAATWRLDNATNTTWDDAEAQNYPVQVRYSPGFVLDGGTIWGEVNQEQDWDLIYSGTGYNGNSAAIEIQYSTNYTISDWRIDKVWDGFRPSAGAGDFLFEGNWLSNVRDDAIENDRAFSGTIRDNLIDGTFQGIALDGDVDGSANTLVIEDSLFRMKEYAYSRDGDGLTHGSLFKADSSFPQGTPDIGMRNVVYAIEDVDHISQNRQQIAFDHVTVAEGNVFLNLSDTPLPSNYPLTNTVTGEPIFDTILQGQAARDYWEAAEANWIASHGETPPPPPPQEETPTFEHASYTGDFVL